MTNDQPELTRREVQVALGVAKGKTCPEIGVTLRLGNESIRSLMKRLREKTGYRRKPQLAVWANDKHGWLESELVRLKNIKKAKKAKRAKKRPRKVVIR